MARSKGKPCGASHISMAKTCRVNMAPALDKALNALSGQIGMKTIWNAVAEGKDKAKEKRMLEIRDEVRKEMGGNIVKGPKADELRRRLQAEGLIPQKPKSEPPAPKKNDIQAQVAAAKARGREAAKSKIKEVEENAPKLLSKPDPLYGAWPTDQLKKFRAGVDEDNPRFEGMRKQIDAELARRGREQQAGPPANSIEALATNQLKNRRDAAWALGKDDRVAQLDAELARRGTKPNEPIVASVKSKMAIESARDFDRDMTREPLTREGDKSFNKWDETTGTGAKKLGQGAFGTVLKTEDGSYAVKRGDVSETEGRIIQKIGEQDLGPKLIASDVDGPGTMLYSPGVDVRRGRIAMSIVDGSPVGNRRADDEVNGVKVADAYWTARANLHRMGIAHNDMHTDNVLIDNNGKGRFVDMGLAQDNPKAAFAEAIGAFDPPRGATVTRANGVQGQGDWQVRQYRGTAGPELSWAQRTGDRKELMEKAPVANRVLDNKNELQYRMQRDGFSKDDIATMMDHGIRNDLSTYNRGVWSRLSDDQAREYINILYDGV